MSSIRTAGAKALNKKNAVGRAEVPPSHVAIPAISWIQPLAAPYLRGYRPHTQRGGELRGLWFSAPSLGKKQRVECGFFLGYLVESGEYAFLAPQPPECIVFVHVHPVGSAAHKQLVAAPESLLRKASTYIRWLTHHLPRFSFHDDAPAALVRHQPMCVWPEDKWEHYSRNFFIETLAWLVRSGLVRKLAEAVAEPRKPGLKKRARKS